MEIVYNILETIIPFDFIDYAFMKNALLAVLLISPIFAILGTMVVNNKIINDPVDQSGSHRTRYISTAFILTKEDNQ